MNTEVNEVHEVPEVPPFTEPIADPFRRDPNGTLAGLASAVAYRYGWDVALTRLAFVVLALATSGFLLVVYLMAWLVIPVADTWPPSELTVSSPPAT